MRVSSGDFIRTADTTDAELRAWGYTGPDGRAQYERDADALFRRRETVNWHMIVWIAFSVPFLILMGLMVAFPNP